LDECNPYNCGAYCRDGIHSVRELLFIAFGKVEASRHPYKSTLNPALLPAKPPKVKEKGSKTAMQSPSPHDTVFVGWEKDLG
jgi:hypothetical protein